MSAEFERFIQRAMTPSNVWKRAPEAVSIQNHPPEVVQHFMKRIQDLIREAESVNAIGLLVDAALLKLALIAYHTGPTVTGDMLRRFGHYLAETEAEQKS